MRKHFIFGAPGVLVSGVLWVCAGILAKFYSFNISIFAFFFGGMLIHPLSILISKTIHKSRPQNKNNPLIKLALEGTIFLFVGLFLAFMLVKTKPELFYPIMLMTIGARYLTFQTLYALKTYWVLGGVLLALGAGLIFQFNLPPYLIALLGGGIELIFSLFLFTNYKRQMNLPQA